MSEDPSCSIPATFELAAHNPMIATIKRRSDNPIIATIKRGDLRPGKPLLSMNITGYPALEEQP
jgi:hypothetical protein